MYTYLLHVMNTYIVRKIFAMTKMNLIYYGFVHNSFQAFSLQKFDYLPLLLLSNHITEDRRLFFWIKPKFEIHLRETALFVASVSLLLSLLWSRVSVVMIGCNRCRCYCFYFHYVSTNDL